MTEFSVCLKERFRAAKLLIPGERKSRCAAYMLYFEQTVVERGTYAIIHRSNTFIQRNTRHYQNDKRAAEQSPTPQVARVLRAVTEDKDAS